MTLAALSIVVLSAAHAALLPDQVLIAPEAAAALGDALFVDTRPAEAFAAAHVPGAARLDPASLSETRDGVIGMLKDPPAALRVLAAAGIGPMRHCVVYAGTHDAGDFKDAARVFWALEYLGFPRVSVLDGGFARWQHEARPTDAGDAVPAPQDPSGWHLAPDADRLATRREVLEALKSGAAQLADLRAPEEYAGLSKKDFVATAGHIPGAYSVPVADLVQETVPGQPAAGYCARPAATVAGALAQREGATPETPVIAYCNSGRDASVGYLLYRRAGFKQVAVYDGSMAEWSQHPPLETK